MDDPRVGGAVEKPGGLFNTSEEEAQEAEQQRKRDKEAAWDRAMLAKERAEREERRKRKAERLQKEGEQAQ